MAEKLQVQVAVTQKFQPTALHQTEHNFNSLYPNFLNFSQQIHNKI
jgi:hypothetical protein